MAILVLLGLLAGMALEKRFRVLVLVPACLLPVALAVGLGRHQAIGAVALMTIATVASVQIGYLARVAIRTALSAARTTGLRDAPLTGSQAVQREAH